MSIDTFIEYNFSPIIGLIFQVLFLVYNKNFSKKERNVFSITIILEIIELVTYNIEFYYSSLSTPSIWRIIFSICGYIVRPALVYPFVYLLRENMKLKMAKVKFWDLIPLAVVIVIQFLAFGTKLVFYFDENNIFHRGPLGYVSHVVTVLYLIEAGVELVVTKTSNRKINVSMFLIVLLFVSLAMVFESAFNIRSLGISAGVFSIVFFMFSLQETNLNMLTNKLKEISEVDFLTQIPNRYAGEQRIQEEMKNKKNGAFLILDIDNFKFINDSYGHSIGDEAIKKIAKALASTFGEKEDVIMRLGGDEFAIFSTRLVEHDEIKTAIDALFDKVDMIRLTSDEKYRIHVSVGLSFYDGKAENSFDNLYKDADAKLYLSKKQDGNYVTF